MLWALPVLPAPNAAKSLVKSLVLSLLVGNLTLPLIQRERRELLSILPLFIMGFFLFFLFVYQTW